MSILLDALKKSESQRQLGETPTLHTQAHDAHPDPDSGRPWTPIVMITAALVIMTWIGLRQYQPVEATRLNDEQRTDTVAVEAETDKPVQETASRPRRAAKTPVMDYQAETNDAAGPESPDQPDSQEMAQSAGPSTVISEGRQSAPGGTSDSRPPPAIEEDPLPEPPDDRLLNPYQAEVLSYWQIPQALRDTMPEMHISVLVYAKRPEDRFLLIDGERLREKEELSSGLVLEEIQSDRAIFTYRNYRFHVKS